MARLQLGTERVLAGLLVRDCDADSISQPVRAPLSKAPVKPDPELVVKWSLSSQQVVMNPQEKNPQKIRRRDYAHVFVMASTTEEKIDALINDLHRPVAFPEQIILPINEPLPELLDEAVPLALVPEAGRGFE
ncbi:hypothetical protein [Streptomyces avermitilis]|uniref:hypothetical protein n=1 Tax=Streptomyces avermitilis TaxID=33903 RepID=UPI0036A25D8B